MLLLFIYICVEKISVILLEIISEFLFVIKFNIFSVEIIPISLAVEKNFLYFQ